MAIVGTIVLGTGVALAVWYDDLFFVVFGVIGATGAGISSVVAIAGQHLALGPANDDPPAGGAGEPGPPLDGEDRTRDGSEPGDGGAAEGSGDEAA